MSPGELHQFLLCSRCSGGNYTRDRWPLRFMAFVVQKVACNIGGDSFLLLIVALLENGYSFRAIEQVVNTLQDGMAMMYRTFGGDTSDGWDPDLYIRASFEGSVVSPELRAVRTRFWIQYATATRLMHRWMATLPAREQRQLRRYVLPAVDPAVMLHLSCGRCHQ